MAAGPRLPAATICRHQRHHEYRRGEGVPRFRLLPRRPDHIGEIAKEALKDLDPRYQIAAEAMAKGRTPYTVVFNDLINSANGPWTQMVNEVFFGDDVDGSIANAQETMQSIIDSAQQ
jgi:hypothetical protein